MTGCGGTAGGHARARALRGRYRAAPREIAIRGEDMAKCMAFLLGMVTLVMVIAFG